jgi:hypothetical protein
MAGASLRIFYTERKGWMLAPPQPWAWYYNPKLLHSTSSTPELDRGRAIVGPYPTGPIAHEHRFNKTEDTWEEFYGAVNRGLEIYAPYKENETPQAEMTDADVDSIVNKLAERGFRLVPIEEDSNLIEEEEGITDGELQHQYEPRDSASAPDGDVAEQESPAPHFVTSPD